MNQICLLTRSPGDQQAHCSVRSMSLGSEDRQRSGPRAELGALLRREFTQGAANQSERQPLVSAGEEV